MLELMRMSMRPGKPTIAGETAEERKLAKSHPFHGEETLHHGNPRQRLP